MPISDFAIVEMMDKYGGSFARALAEAARRADTENLDRLKSAFPEMWAEYAELARLREVANERAALG